MSDTVTITITYPAPGTPRDMDAVTSVLIAADPYWRADYSSENTPGQGGGYHRCRRVAGRCGRHCRRSPRRGPRVVDQHQQHPPPVPLEPSTFAHGSDGKVRGRPAP
jgi:hypothetical protein